ncbi:hypothetical protein Y032_0101g3414 [Ancylostoma ceylanicum]|uniref:Uncharacterized protein n=1 Tax=Ancylostoma ceylanicum TaxID=53326 RepID=A0A016THZ5_9BILA|nr:hypothetical protein Y032_0101g3414 [Ancylostoma ceylanicum]
MKKSCILHANEKLLPRGTTCSTGRAQVPSTQKRVRRERVKIEQGSEDKMIGSFRVAHIQIITKSSTKVLVIKLRLHRYAEPNACCYDGFL